MRSADVLQIIYISSAAPGFDPAEVEDILTVSRRNNGADRVTGLLVHDGRRFLQALEGDETAVERAFARIKADPRHRAIVKLSSKTVESREFGDWAMAAQSVAVVSGASVPEVVDAFVTQVPDANTRALFSGFARVRKAA